jgi:hypothetical protein
MLSSNVHASARPLRASSGKICMVASNRCLFGIWMGPDRPHGSRKALLLLLETAGIYCKWRSYGTTPAGSVKWLQP